eukprot:TRINITY_DN9891_c0_g1_i1.p1 TRINITY_DN9891_c0_g1~~TRINITY_DN9891_c0_g1_i1.p1  ORF type:complete len:324 (-),score=68.08 TRINITY_DN9891_c0_g1_i1:55-1026(-)
MTFEHPNTKMHESLGARATKGSLVLILIVFIGFQVAWYYYGSEIVDVVEVEDVLVENKLCSLEEIDQTRSLFSHHMLGSWQTTENQEALKSVTTDPKTIDSCRTKPKIAVYVNPNMGAQYIQHLLNSHSEVDVAAEIFSDASAANAAFSKEDVESVLSKLLKKKNGMLLPFEAHEQTPELLHYFSRNNWTVIYVVRQNLLDQLIADTRDKSTDKTSVSLPTGSALISRLVTLRAQRDLARANFEEHSLDWIEVNFEDLVEEPRDVLCNLLLFVGCSCPAISDGLSDADVGDLSSTRSQLVSNWDDVRQTLEGTMFETFATTNN